MWWEYILCFWIENFVEVNWLFFDVVGQKKGATLGNPQAMDTNSLLIDVDVQPLDDNPSTQDNKQQDVDHFFHTAVTKDVNSKSKKYCTCKLCL